MVVQKTNHLPENNGTQYWKLQRTDQLDRKTLKKRSNAYPLTFFHFKSASKPRLLKLVLRPARGLISYDAFKANELSKFCDQRRLYAPSGPKKQELIRVLEAADEDEPFDRFMDLPPELRVRIYELLFDSYPELHGPVQPPITRVCRQIREESVFVFYQRCTFMLTTKSFWDDDAFPLPGSEAPEPEYVNKLNDNIQAFFDGTRSNYLERIRKLHVVGTVLDVLDFVADGWLLRLGKDKVDESCSPSAAAPEPEVSIRTYEKVKWNLQEVVEAMGVVSGRRVLRRRDVGKILDVLNDALDESDWHSGDE